MTSAIEIRNAGCTRPQKGDALASRTGAAPATHILRSVPLTAMMRVLVMDRKYGCDVVIGSCIATALETKGLKLVDALPA